MSSPEFSKLRFLFWPIKRYELKKFIPMFLISFFICFIYSFLKSAKDALVITASGAEIIPFIKVWAILPFSLLMTFLFTKLANRYKSTHVFYIMMAIFLAFYVIFAFFLYPYQEFLHPTTLADRLENLLPSGFHGLIALFRNWSFTLFYVMSELWGTAIMLVLFWGFANEVTKVEEAKRFYGILYVGSNLSTILAGVMAGYMDLRSVFRLPFFQSYDDWGNCLASIVTIVAMFGIASMITFYWLTKRVIPQNQFIRPEKASKTKMGLKKNFNYLAKSKYLVCLAMIVLLYNISINMVEIVWKDQVRNLFPSPTFFNAYMGKIQILIGSLSTILSWLLCGSIILRFGWTFSALLTPIILLVSSLPFFCLVLFKDAAFLGSFSMLLGTTPLALTVFFGSLQNCLSKGAKYTFFDATKEVAFIPLSNECKLKGKASIDGVGSRLGKSGGSIIHQFFLMGFGTVAACSPFVGVFLLLIIVGWIIAIKSLGKQFNELSKSKEQITIEEEEKQPALVSEPAN